MTTARAAFSKLKSFIKKNILLLVVLGFILRGLLMLTSFNIIWDGIPPHHGDGVFTDNSLKMIGPLGVHAYSIRMPDFDLGNLKEETYVVSNLTPKRSRLGLEVFLGIEDDIPVREPALEKQNLKGLFRIFIKDSRGKLILHVEDDMSNCIWGEMRNLRQKDNSWVDVYLLYPRDQNFHFTPIKKETYQIFLRYTPDPRLEGLKGFVGMKYNRF